MRRVLLGVLLLFGLSGIGFGLTYDSGGGGGSGTISSGTTNKLSKYTGTTTLGNSLIYDDGSKIGISTTVPAATLELAGNLSTLFTFHVGEPVGTADIFTLRNDGKAIFGTPTGLSYNNKVNIVNGNLGLEKNSGTYDVGGNVVIYQTNFTNSPGFSFGGISSDSANSFVYFKYDDNTLSVYSTLIALSSSGTFTQSGNKAFHTFAMNTTSPTPVSGQGSIWAVTAAGGSAEMKVMDGAGNITQISPHDPETGNWVFNSENDVTGKSVYIDMESFIRRIEELTGEKFIFKSREESLRK
jgi:hypothetical protein